MKKWKILIPIILAIILCVVVAIFIFLGAKEYTVSFMSEDGTVIQQDTYKEGELLTVPADPTKEGHTFVGWALDGSAGAYDFTADNASVVNKDMSFSPIFTANSYIIKFVAANGVDVISQETYTFGEKFEIPDAPDKEGHTFVGWTKQGTSNVVDLTANGATTVQADATFIAKYEKVKVKVTFTNMDGTVVMTQNLGYGDYFAVPEDPVLEGFLFKGWALAGETEIYDFERENAKLVGSNDIVFVAIYDNVEIVTGTIKKLDGTAVPQEVIIRFGTIEMKLTVGSNGAFTVQLPQGTYSVEVVLEGYKSVSGDITVKAGNNAIGTIKLMQALTVDAAWWTEGTLTEKGNSATITMPKDAHADAGQEFRIGEFLQNASSWKVSAQISKGAIGRRGFTFGTEKGGQAAFFVYVDDTVAGVYTWGTFKNVINDAQSVEWELSDAVKAVMQSDKGYELTLVATNINGEGTGWLTLYVNETIVARFENTFVGVEGPHIQDGVKLDLGNGHISLAVRGTSAKATFKNYYYTTSKVSNLQMGTISGKLEKADGSELPKSVIINFGLFEKKVDLDANGRFETTVPVGEYALLVNSVDIQVTVNKGNNDVGTIKLLEPLYSDMAWWQEAELIIKDGNATIKLPAGAFGDAGQEIRVGDFITNATSWKITTHIAKGAVGRHGLSVGANGANGTVFFYVEGDWAGYYTWWTYVDALGGAEKQWELSAEAKAAIQSENGYDLSLVATNINGEGTGWLTLYVNDIPVVQIENNFVGSAGNPHVAEGAKLDLSNVHLSLVVRGDGATATFSNYYYTLNSESMQENKVIGSVVKLDGSALPSNIVLDNGLSQKTVAVNADGSFETYLLAGEYRVVVDGYRTVINSITVNAGVNNVGQIELIQGLAMDMGWWQGGSLTENGNSATITMGEGEYGDGGQEVRIGEYITSANSWRVTTHINKGAVGRHGISVGANDCNGTVFFFIEGEWVGYYTWWTFLNPNGGTEEAAVLPEAARTAIQAEGGYDLTLVATNINGAGTGTLSFYVNDILVMQVQNFFVGGAGSPHVAEGAKLDLSYVHLNLAIRGIGATATFSDYSYTLNKEAAPALPDVVGDMEWWTGTTMTQNGNSTTITVSPDASSDAGYEARVGDFITNATSWKITTHIAKGAVGRHGLSVGTNGANGTVFFFLEGDWVGYYTWWTYLNPNGGAEEAWLLPEEAKIAMQSEAGYDISLVATDINGAGTGTLTFLVNDIVVAQVQNFFVGAGGPHVAEGAKLDLSNVHLDLAVRGNGSTATFSDYSYTINGEYTFDNNGGGSGSDNGGQDDGNDGGIDLPIRPF